MNRYLKMTPSVVVDPEDGEQYPDPLSVTYDGDITRLPTAHTITAVDISKFWVYFYEKYGAVEGDDILLSRNGIPYIGMLKPGDTIFELDKNELYDIEFLE